MSLLPSVVVAVVFLAEGALAAANGSDKSVGGRTVPTVPAVREDALAAAVNVRRMGAKGDGRADDTAAFRAAVARAAKSGGRVIVPGGVYRISSPIRLEKVRLIGAVVGAWPADVEALPSIVPTHRNGPAFILGAGGALAGLDVTYHWKAEPKSGPAAVLVTGIGVYIRDLRIRQAWDGILTDGEHNVGRLNITNVFLVSVRNIGVRVTGTWDAPRLANVEVWNAGPVKHGFESGVGFLLGKNDLIRMTDCFAFGMRYGFLFQDELDGCRIKGGTWGVLNGCATDFCVEGIVVRGAHTLSISGGSFWDHQESLVVDGSKARVRVTGCELKSNGAPAAAVRNADHVVITGCTISRPMKRFDAPAVRIQAGDAVLTSNRIEAAHDGIEIGEGRPTAVISDNLIRCPGRGVPRPAGDRERLLIQNNLVRPPRNVERKGE